MLAIKKISETIGLSVFTERGGKFGEVEEAILLKNRIDAWRIRATKDSFVSKALTGAKGVVVPHQLVKSIGDIMIVSQAAAPSYEEEEAKAT